MSNEQKVILEVPQAPKGLKKVKAVRSWDLGNTVTVIVLGAVLVFIFLICKNEIKKEKRAEDSRKKNEENLQNLVEQNEKIISLLTEIKEQKKQESL